MIKKPMSVFRRYSTGNSELVGRLVENRRGVYFQYDTGYLDTHKSSISPFKIPFDMGIHKGPDAPHDGLHGVFSDSLPDGWGMYLMDKYFMRNGIDPNKVSLLERLSFNRGRGMGALYYRPDLYKDEYDDLDIQELGDNAVSEFEGLETHHIRTLAIASGSGGARPKLNVTLKKSGEYTTDPNAAGVKLLIKLGSSKQPEDEVLVEYAYMRLAYMAGIEVPEFNLIKNPPKKGRSRYWLSQRRFDCIGAKGRLHTVSLCGMLDADYRSPSMDYQTMLKATSNLCGITEARKLLSRILFNFLMANQDDHTKNFAYVCNDEDRWSLSPFYDLTFSPNAFNSHSITFNGEGRLRKSVFQLMARHVGVTDIEDIVDEVVGGCSKFKKVAKNVGINEELTTLIYKTLRANWKFFKEG